MKTIFNMIHSFVIHHKAFTVVVIIAGLLVFHSAINYYHNVGIASVLCIITVLGLRWIWFRRPVEKIIVVKEKKNNWIYW